MFYIIFSWLVIIYDNYCKKTKWFQDVIIKKTRKNALLRYIKIKFPTFQTYMRWKMGNSIYIVLKTIFYFHSPGMTDEIVAPF